MHTRTTIILCALLTVMLCVPSLLHVPLLLPLADPVVRAAAPEAVREVRRTHGWWMVHADLTHIEKTDEATCFDWIYRYRSGYGEAPPRTERTCIPTDS